MCTRTTATSFVFSRYIPELALSRNAELSSEIHAVGAGDFDVVIFWWLCIWVLRECFQISLIRLFLQCVPLSAQAANDRLKEYPNNVDEYVELDCSAILDASGASKTWHLEESASVNSSQEPETHEILQ